MPRRTAALKGIRDRDRVQALVRGLEVLGYLNRVGIASNTLVAKRFHLKVSTAHRILMVLTRMGILRHDVRGHQFMLASSVRTLSTGFRESRFVDDVALPRMQAWSRRHGIRLLLVAEDDGELVVRASTATHWPLARELPVAGNVLTELGCSEAAILRQYSARNRKPRSATGTDALLRRQVAVRTTGPDRERQIGVLLLTKDGFRGCLSIRCSMDIARTPKTVRHWAAELRTLSANIVAAQDWGSNSAANHSEAAT